MTMTRSNQPAVDAQTSAEYTDMLRRLRRIRKMRPAAPRTIATGMMGGTYTGNELRDPAVRPGADDHMAHPGRMGDRLHYRDGRREVFG